MERQTLTVEEAAHVLGISRGLAYELARSGQLPVVRLGRRMVVPRAALEAMLTGQPASQTPEDAQPRVPRPAEQVAGTRLDTGG